MRGENESLDLYQRRISLCQVRFFFTVWFEQCVGVFTVADLTLPYASRSCTSVI